MFAVNYYISFLSWAGMTESKKKQKVLCENLYEIPSCTICLQELVQEMGCLDCGHVFHISCISQQFEYRNSCPNCQKRACLKELRPIVFLLTLNSKANSLLHNILSTLDHSQVKQVEHLLHEVKVATESVERLRVSLTDSEKQLATQTKLVEGLREDLGRKRSQLELLRKENLKLQKSGKEQDEEIKQRERLEIKLRIEVEGLKKIQEDAKKIQKYSKMMKDKSENTIKYKESLEQSGTPPQEMSRIFFDMLCMKNLEELKHKEKMKEYPQTIKEKDNEILKLRGTVDQLKKTIKQATKQAADKRVVQRKKYDDLKAKYRQLIDKAKQKGVRENDIPEMEDSQGFNNLGKSGLLFQEPIVQNTMRKPHFNPDSKIGGILKKKKDDNLKFLF